MFERIGSILSSIAGAKYDFDILGNIAGRIFGNMAANETIAGIWEAILSAISPFAAFVPFALIILALIEVFFGKKLINLQKFLACVVVGFCFGVHYVSPLINNIFNLPPYISGAVIALVAAVLCKFIYVAGYVFAAGYSGYLIAYSGAYIPFLSSVTKGNLIISLAIALAFVAVALIFRKYIEMFGTAALGGYFISKTIIANFFDYRTLEFLGEVGWIAELVLILVIAIVGFIVQYKTRTRY